MTSHSTDIRVTTITWSAAVVILLTTLSCDSIGPEPKPVPRAPGAPQAPQAPETPKTPESPAVPAVPETPMVPITHGQIVFLDPWEQGAIFVADSTGQRLQRVYQTSGARDLSVSADGLNIAFSTPCTFSVPCSQVYIKTVGREDLLLLETGDPVNWPAHPAFSPDGKRIAFVQGRIGPPGLESRNIYAINADGTGLTQLTQSGYNEEPAWSPDGRKIIFTRSENDGTGLHYGILEMDPDGSNVRELRSGFRDHWPTLSPDGSRIAFVGLNPEDYEMNLFVMNADGSSATILKPGLNRILNNDRIAWSPDSKSITFIVNSAARMCEDIWDFGLVPCGQSAKRIGLDGVVDPLWELPSASTLVWQR